MPSSSVAARNYRIGAERITSARARNARTGVTPLPPGGASVGAFGAKLATLALEHYTNKGKVDEAALKEQRDAQYRELQIAKLQREMATPEAPTYTVDGIEGITPGAALTHKRLTGPKEATPETPFPESERGVLGIPPEITTRAGANAYLANQRANQRRTDVARLNSESVRAARQIAALKDEEARYANQIVVRYGLPRIQDMEIRASHPDPKIRAKALADLGLSVEMADLQPRILTDIVRERVGNLRTRWEAFARDQAGRRYAPKRDALSRRLEGLRAAMPVLEEEAAAEEVVETPAEKAFREALDN